MSFDSATSQSQAKSTVNKLLANFLPGAAIASTTVVPTKPTAKAQTVAKELSKKSNPEELKRIAKKQKLAQRKKILKNSETTKKFNKLAKYNSIKAHKESGNITPQEEKYLSKLVRKNISAVNSLSEIDDPELKQELSEVKKDILSIYAPVKKSKKQSSKQKDFNTKIQKGYISYPGLTPGLAPVDYNESDSE
ncbi:regulator of rDNA transcription protein 14 [[Candida] anglica]|uniref:Regulator of rDNA transcription 14 n=1 Tax=[Candida] anglica TaxID=148631 RepID=A0ABP0EF81_9ASCO